MADPHVMQAGHAPTPFTAAEIRGGCPSGRRVTTRAIDGSGQTSTTVTVFRDVDELGATFVTAAGPHRVTWEGLQRHASFPEADTTIEPAAIDTPLGTLDCLLYTVVRRPETHRFWFARDLPGMPVRTEISIEDEVISRTDVIENAIE